MVGLFRRLAFGQGQDELRLDLDSLAVGLNGIALSLMEEARSDGDGANVDRDTNDLMRQVKALEQSAQGVRAMDGAIDAVRTLVRHLNLEQKDFKAEETRHGRICRELAEEAKRIEEEVKELSEG
jgi:hypothetical protein